MEEKLIKIVFTSSDKIQNGRTLDDIFINLISEIGELSDEISVIAGRIDPSKADKDGVVGEAIDCISCLLDIIKKHSPDISIDTLNNLMYTKCKKWEDVSLILKKR